MSTSKLQYGKVQNYLDGDWVVASGDGQAVENPATNEPIAHIGFSTVADVDDAVAAGQTAFESWRGTPVEERMQPLFRLKQLLEEHQDELAELLVEEHGKTLDEARDGASSAVASRTWRWPAARPA